MRDLTIPLQACHFEIIVSAQATQSQMKLSTSSNLSFVGRLRYIQAIHEPPERRGPDRLVRHFFPVPERWRCRFLSRDELDKLRSLPFYYYLLARTKYYDAVFSEAINGNVTYIVNVGCGTDTRAHRFGLALERQGITVLECDLPEVISAKRRIGRRLGPAGHVQYLSLDLNDEAWLELMHWLDKISGAKVMVMMEGVSPFIGEETFSRFLMLLGTKLARGSMVAYDFKLEGVADDFGRAGLTGNTFRLPDSREQILAYHKQSGFRLTHMELSWELEARLLPDLAEARIPFFRQDGLVQIQVEERPECRLL